MALNYRQLLDEYFPDDPPYDWQADQDQEAAAEIGKVPVQIGSTSEDAQTSSAEDVVKSESNPLTENFARQQEQKKNAQPYSIYPKVGVSPLSVGTSLENMPDAIEKRKKEEEEKRIEELKNARDAAKENQVISFQEYIDNLNAVMDDSKPKYTEEEIDRYQKANASVGGLFSALAGAANSIAVGAGAYSAQVPDAYKQVYDHWENIRKDNRQRQQAYDKIRMQIAGIQYQHAEQKYKEVKAEFDKAVAEGKAENAAAAERQLKILIEKMKQQGLNDRELMKIMADAEKNEKTLKQRQSEEYGRNKRHKETIQQRQAEEQGRNDRAENSGGSKKKEFQLNEQYSFKTTGAKNDDVVYDAIINKMDELSKKKDGKESAYGKHVKFTGNTKDEMLNFIQSNFDNFYNNKNSSSFKDWLEGQGIEIVQNRGEEDDGEWTLDEDEEDQDNNEEVK